VAEVTGALDELRQDYCIFEDFGVVLDLLEGKEEESGDYDDEGDDEEGDDYDDMD
jgi:hypothetical protein